MYTYASYFIQFHMTRKRRRSSIGRLTLSQKRFRVQTENETQEARDQRTSLVRQRMAAYRENQNEEDRNVQRLLARQRMAEYRSQETEDVRNQRLSLNNTN